MEKIMQWAGKLLPESYRTKLAGVSFIMLGLVGFFNIIWPDMAVGEISMTVEACVASIATGAGMIGLGKKIDRNTEAVKLSVK